MKQLLLLSYLIVKSLILPAINADENMQTFINKADSCYELLNFECAKVIYAEVISSVNKEDDPILFSYLLNQYASSLFWLDEIIEAEAACRISLNYVTKALGPLHPFTAEAHINLGAQKFISGNSGIIAEHFYEAALILENYYGKPHPKVAKAYEWLGTFYESRSDTAVAREYLWKSLDIYTRTIGAKHPDVAELYRYIGLFYKRFHEPDSALFYFSKAKLLFDETFGEANFHSVKCLNNISDVYISYFNQWEEAENIYYQCLELIKGFRCPNRYTHAMTLYRMVDYSAKNQDYFQAIDYMNQILPLYYPDFENRNLFDNPDGIHSNLSTVPKLIFIYKANILNKLASLDTINSHVFLKSASDCYALLDEVIDEIRSNLVGYDALLQFANSHAKLYYMMAINELNLFELTTNKRYLNKALYYGEKKKLACNYKKYRNKFWHDMDPNDVSLSQIGEIQKDINTLKAQRLVTEEKELIDRQIVQKTLLIDYLHAEMKEIQIEADIFDFQIDEIQSRLKPNECLLYFADNTQDYKQIPNSLIVIAINKEQAEFVEILGQEIFFLVSEYNRLMASNYSLDSINSIGAQLYNKLISPVSGLLKWKIIIQPSTFLSTLSFESLPETAKSEKPSFLIENHLIWKIFSLSDLQANAAVLSHNRSDSVLAVAPIFNTAKMEEIALLTQRDASLINLAGAVHECSMIANYFGTLLLSGLDVSKAKFKENCNRFPYIHISTHGVPTEDDNAIVKLAFNPKGDGDNGWLNFYEILNLNLNADLVVLSACKTGVGKRNNGEGNLNLAWAFRQAGARSSIISLWDVNDYASSQIMPDFYMFLSEGYSKPEALRLAKLRFIANHDQLAAAPFYWAAFDFIGYSERDSIGKNTIADNLFIGFAALLFVLIGLTFLIIKNQKKTQPYSPDLFQ